MDEDEYDVPAVPCPVCGKPNDAMRSVEPGQRGPQPGDISMCFTCGAVLRVTEGSGRLDFDAFALQLKVDPDIVQQLNDRQQIVSNADLFAAFALGLVWGERGVLLRRALEDTAGIHV